MNINPRYIKREYNTCQSHMIEMGIEFYIAARICYHKNLIGTYLILPILFHHAIEYLIKGYLSHGMSMKELKDKFGHDLIKLWKKFKENDEDENMAKYDIFIDQFNKAWNLRYPAGDSVDSISVNNPTLCLARKLDGFDSNSVEWSLETIDEIIYSICKKMTAPVSPLDYIGFKFRNCDDLYLNNRYFKKYQEITVESSREKGVE